MPFFQIEKTTAGFSAVVLSLIAVGISRADDALIWKFTKGKTLRYRRVQERLVTNTVGGRDVETRNDRTTDLSLTIDDVDAKGVATVTMTINRMRLKRVSPRGAAEVDSNNNQSAAGEAQSLAGTAKLFAGSEFSFRMTPQGQIDKFELSAATKDKFKAVPALDAKSMQLLVPALPVPEGKVSINQEWQREDKLNIPGIGDLKIDRKFKYLGPKAVDGQTLPEIESSLGVDLAQTKNPLANVQLDDWTHEGTIRFDRTAGRLVAQKDKGQMKMTIKAQGQSIPTVGDTIESVTLLKDGD